MYQKTVLPNGVRIVTEEIPHVRSVALGFWVGVGSRDEDPPVNGISHFIEHLMFKGTAKRSARRIAEEMDAIGGQLNAFTAKEYTCYYVRMLDEHFEQALDVLADMFFHSRFDEEELEKEKNVVLEEIAMYEDAPDELIHDVFAQALWNEHALGQPIIGSKEVISRLSREDVFNFYKNYYSPDKLVVAVAGNIKHDRAVSLLTPYLDNFKGESRGRTMSSPEKRSTVVVREKETEQVHLCLGTVGLPLDHKGIYSLHILNTVLGGGLSSRLFQGIREERGLVYSVYSYHSSYHDTGLFSIYTALNKTNLNEVLNLISHELNNLKREGLPAEELTRAKEHLKGSLVLSLESVHSRMNRLGKTELSLGRVITVDETLSKIEAVTADDIAQMSARLFQNDRFTMACLGPVNGPVEIPALD